MRSTCALWLTPLVSALIACDGVEAPQVPATDDATPTPAAAQPLPVDTAAPSLPPTTRPTDRADCNPSGRGSITPAGVGAVRLGQVYEELREICPGEAVQMQTEVHHGAAYKLADGLHALLSGNKVSGVLVEAADPATAGGLNVGSTVRDVRRASDHICAGIGATGVDVWQRKEGIIYSTSASPAALTADLARDRYEAASALPDGARVERILVTKAPFCEERPPVSSWNDLKGKVEVFLLDEDLVTVAVDAAGLAPGRYDLAIGPAAAEGLRLQRSNYRVLSGRFDGRIAEPDASGGLRIEFTLPRARFGPDRKGAVALRAGAAPPHMATFSLESDG